MKSVTKLNKMESSKKQDKRIKSSRTVNMEQCIKKYNQAFTEKQSMAFAVISALNQVIKQSKETTISALLGEFKLCADHLLMTIKNNPDFADRTLLSMRALVRIYQRMAQKVEYQ